MSALPRHRDTHRLAPQSRAGVVGGQQGHVRRRATGGSGGDAGFEGVVPLEVAVPGFGYEVLFGHSGEELGVKI